MEEKMSEAEIIAEMQLVTEQMVVDDIEENPEIVEDFFTCDCCAKEACLAGSIEYQKGYRLCNDCVLFAEIGFALNKISTIEDLIKAMEEKRLEALCDYIRSEETKLKN